jgi:hypothetical protein
MSGSRSNKVSLDCLVFAERLLGAFPRGPSMLVKLTRSFETPLAPNKG